MAQAPIMPVFTDALIGDTTHLSTEQFGAYVLILIATWRNNGEPLPDDDKQLANVTRAGLQKWKKNLRPMVSKFFTVNASGWHQKRLESEWQRVSAIIQKRRVLGAAGRLAKATAKATAKALANGHANETEPMNQREASLPHQNPKDILKPESEAAREEEEKNHEGNPEARCARLGSPAAPSRRTCADPPIGFSRRAARPPPCKQKSPALKARIKEQLRAKHARFLMARKRPEEVAAYWAAALDADPAVAQRMFDETDARMRRANWDDMRQWKAQRGWQAIGSAVA